MKFFNKISFFPRFHVLLITKGLMSRFWSCSFRAVYETCKLGTHAPAVTPGLTGSTSAGFSKSVLPGFMIVDSPCPSTQSAPTSTLIGDFVASMDSGWNFNEFRKSLSKVCKNVPILANPSSSQRDPDQGQSVVLCSHNFL